jgi:hypothetical protein
MEGEREKNRRNIGPLKGDENEEKVQIGAGKERKRKNKKCIFDPVN